MKQLFNIVNYPFAQGNIKLNYYKRQHRPLHLLVQKQKHRVNKLLNINKTFPRLLLNMT